MLDHKRMKRNSMESSCKKQFTISEDLILYKYICKYGAKNWNCAASILTGRTPKQCRDRWHNHLDPNINKGPWTFEEDRILAEQHEILGNRWSDIASYLPGRTDTHEILNCYSKPFSQPDCSS